MVPIDHSRLHARDFGGQPEDYLKIDEFLDQTKFQFTDFRHRAILHNPMGIALCEQIFGPTIKNSAGKEIAVRELARRHIVQDCGLVPTTKEWIDALCEGHARKYNNVSRTDLEWLKRNYYESANNQ